MTEQSETREPQEIWLVVEGDYSAYHVRQLFATRELADAYVEGGGWRDHNSYDHVRVEDEPLRLITELPAPVPWVSIRGAIGQTSYRPYRDGTDTSEEWDVFFPGVDTPPGPEACRVNEYSHAYDDDEEVSLVVTGSDVERVRKVYSERRAQIVAELTEIIARARATIAQRQREFYR